VNLYLDGVNLGVSVGVGVLVRDSRIEMSTGVLVGPGVLV
jgi:hypothetical protein